MAKDDDDHHAHGRAGRKGSKRRRAVRQLQKRNHQLGRELEKAGWDRTKICNELGAEIRKLRLRSDRYKLEKKDMRQRVKELEQRRSDKATYSHTSPSSKSLRKPSLPAETTGRAAQPGSERSNRHSRLGGDSQIKTSRREITRSQQDLRGLKREKNVLEESIKSFNHELSELHVELSEFHNVCLERKTEFQDQEAQQAHLSSKLELQAALDEANALVQETHERMQKTIDRQRQQLDLWELITGIGPVYPIPESPRQSSKQDVPAHFTEATYADLKCKVHENLYIDTESHKRMRSSEELSFPELNSEILKGVCQYTTIAQNEVLRVASRGGLINPLHFEVDRSGIVTINELGLKRVALFHKHKSQVALIQHWRDQMRTEASNLVRSILESSGLDVWGDESVLPLQQKLAKGGEATPQDLIYYIKEIEGHVGEKVDTVAQFLQSVNAIKHNPLLFGDLVKGLGHVKPLFSSYSGHKLAPKLQNLLGCKRHETPLLCKDAIHHLRQLNGGYQHLFRVTNELEVRTKMPGHYLAPTAPMDDLEFGL